MTQPAALALLRRKARYALQPQFATVVTDEDVIAVLEENTRTESVVDSTGLGVDTAVYDTTNAAIQLLEMVAPHAPVSKSIGGVSVSYEAIADAIRRLKSTQVGTMEFGRYPMKSSVTHDPEEL